MILQAAYNISIDDYYAITADPLVGDKEKQRVKYMR